MTTLSELLDNLDLDTEEAVDPDGERLQEIMDGTEKTASEGEEQMGLTELYTQIVEAEQAEEEVYTEDDFDKLAAAQAEDEYGVEKLAHEYDAAGRIMARGFMDEFMKIADAITEEASHAQTPALGERGLEPHLPVNMDPNSGSQPNPHAGRDEHAQILQGKGPGPAGDAQGAMGGQFVTARDVVPTPKQTNG